MMMLLSRYVILCDEIETIRRMKILEIQLHVP